MKNIVLIGLMGSGKSDLGKKLADQTGMAFIDLDAFIEQRAGMSVSEIFEAGGETDFRDRETEAAKLVSQRTDTVVAAGGGTVLRPENVAVLSKTGFLIFIDRPVEQIIQDVDRGNRPLLKDGANRLREISRRRQDIYESVCDLRLDNSAGLAEAEAALLDMAETLRAPRFHVIGDPIEHSKSPNIHLPILQAYTDSPSYERVLVKRGGLPRYLAQAAATGIRGFNLTMPHKQDILPYLDAVSDEARMAGSVNTVVIRRGERFGYTTDGAGFFAALDGAGIDYVGKHLLILGAGGVARAIALAGALRGASKIGVLARRLDAAETLVQELGDAAQASLYAGLLQPETLGAGLSDVDILVNATPQGMTGVNAAWETLAFLDCLPKHAAVCDLIYDPSETAFLKRAKELEFQTMGGLPMLIYQAIVADTLYLGRDINGPEMYRRVLDALNSERC